jgi:uncharacterized protein (DUF58 family)
MAEEKATRRSFEKEIKDLAFKWSRVCDQNRLRDSSPDSIRRRVETELAYLIDEIERGPYYFQVKCLDQAHQRIDEVRDQLRRERKQ